MKYFSLTKRKNRALGNNTYAFFTTPMYIRTNDAGENVEKISSNRYGMWFVIYFSSIFRKNSFLIVDATDWRLKDPVFDLSCRDMIDDFWVSLQNMRAVRLFLGSSYLLSFLFTQTKIFFLICAFVCVRLVIFDVWIRLLSDGNLKVTLCWKNIELLYFKVYYLLLMYFKINTYFLLCWKLFMSSNASLLFILGFDVLF